VAPDGDAGTRASPRAARAAHDAGDAQLVRALCDGDDTALAAIYRRHADTCFALARRILNDRPLAEEVVQEVFLRVWRQPERFDATRGSLRSYLLAQVHGRAVDLLRSEVSRRGREERDAQRASTSDDGFERAVLDLNEAEAVRAALQTLSEPERRAIELAYFGGHTYREVAVLLEQPEGTVKSRIRSGLFRLRASLIDAGILE
jgi:RNA polymerase sigma-70 factor (ECF subfamily)